MVNLKAEISEREKNALQSGMSKRHAISLIYLQKLGSSCIDIPIPIDAYDLQKAIYDNQDTKLDNREKAHNLAAKQHNQPETLLHSRLDIELQNNTKLQNNFNTNTKPDSIPGNLRDNPADQTYDDQLSYKSTKTPREIIDFCMSNMERSGWQFCTNFYAHETLLSFEKPDRRCIISIRPHKKYTHVFIFISDRILT